MPIYDYHCDHCGHSFSAVQRFADDAISVCPSCGKLPRKLMSNPALVFKGSGWYKTDSRGPEKKDGSGGTGTDHGKDSKDASTPSKDKKGVAAGGSGDGPAPSGGGTEGSNSASPSGSAAPEPAKKPEKAAPASS